MSEGNRLAGVAIVVILLFALFVGYGLGRIDSPQRISSEHRHQDACRDGDYARCETKPIILEPSGEQRPADPYEKPHRDEYRAESDLAAQWTMAKWARGAFFASLVGIALLFVTWQATAQGVRETRKIGEKQVQAYLIANKGQFWLRDFFHQESRVTELGITSKLTISNKGQSPGRDIRIEYDGHLWKELVDRKGWWNSYFHCSNETFCPDVAPQDSERAIVEFPLFSQQELATFEQSHSYVEVFGVIHWTNEFGNHQTQKFTLHSHTFWKSAFSDEKGLRDSSVTLDLESVGRREV